MMGERRVMQDALLYGFNLERQSPMTIPHAIAIIQTSAIIAPRCRC